MLFCFSNTNNKQTRTVSQQYQRRMTTDSFDISDRLNYCAAVFVFITHDRQAHHHNTTRGTESFRLCDPTMLCRKLKTPNQQQLLNAGIRSKRFLFGRFFFFFLTYICALYRRRRLSIRKRETVRRIGRSKRLRGNSVLTTHASASRAVTNSYKYNIITNFLFY